MDLRPFVERLKTNIALFKQVGGSADIPSTGQTLIANPACFVVPLAESAESNTLLTGAISQRVTVRIGVVLAVRNVSDAVGMASVTDLDVIRGLVKQNLIGWQPAEQFDQVTFVGGNLIKLDDDAVLWWIDTFETNYEERTM